MNIYFVHLLGMAVDHCINKMKKLVYIFGLFAVVAVLASCEKEEVKPVFLENTTDSGNNRSFYDKNDSGQTSTVRGGEDDGDSTTTSGGVNDPNGDEDYDGIVDPDKDEDFDKEGKGK